MPIKFKPSQKSYKKGEGTKTDHFYIKHMSKDALFEAVNEGKVKPKVRRKCIIELERRGVRINWVKVPKASIV